MNTGVSAGLKCLCMFLHRQPHSVIRTRGYFPWPGSHSSLLTCSGKGIRIIKRAQNNPPSQGGAGGLGGDTLPGHGAPGCRGVRACVCVLVLWLCATAKSTCCPVLSGWCRYILGITVRVSVSGESGGSGGDGY